MRVERIVNSFLNSNTFILSLDGENEVFLVDIGDIKPLEHSLKGKSVGGIFLTHAHYDHIYGINQLINHYPECIVYGSRHTLQALKNDKLNFSYYYDLPLGYNGTNEAVIIDGQKIKLWKNFEIEVLITPGHTPGSTCFRAPADLFTGDAFIPNVPIITKLKEGNREQALKSVERIKTYMTNGLMIHPGHLCQYNVIDNALQPIGQ